MAAATVVHMDDSGDSDDDFEVDEALAAVLAQAPSKNKHTKKRKAARGAKPKPLGTNRQQDDNAMAVDLT